MEDRMDRRTKNPMEPQMDSRTRTNMPSQRRTRRSVSDPLSIVLLVAFAGSSPSAAALGPAMRESLDPDGFRLVTESQPELLLAQRDRRTSSGDTAQPERPRAKDRARRGSASAPPPLPPSTPKTTSTPAPTSGAPSRPGAPVVPGDSGVPGVPGEDEAEAARVRATKMQELSEAHVRDLAAASEQFQEKMKTARTPEERTAAQREFQRIQAERNQEFQKKMAELKQR